MLLTRFQKALIFSIVFHAIVALVVWLEPSFLIPKSPTKTQIEWVDARDLLQKQEEDKLNGRLVSQDKTINDEADKKAKYLSQFNQKVEKETIAALHGDYKNTDGKSATRSKVAKTGEGKSPAEKDANTEKKQASKEVMTDENGVGSVRSMKNFVPSFRPKPIPMGQQAASGGEGPSSTDDRLKDVPTGLQTMLNTREFVYYSYYNRIKEKLRQYWEPKIKEKMERVLRQGRSIASLEQERITKCVILLDEKGKLVRVQVIGESGLVDLDQAAVEAFQAAAPFPNPPKGIVEKDGYIRIRWDFVLEADNTSFLKFGRFALNQ
jgi:TonB family protein